MYKKLVNNMLHNSQIYNNLKRTSKLHQISMLNKIQMNTLALKYFGVDSEGNFTSEKSKIVNYACPYSGKIASNNLHLEHILPISSKGGTALFNCIPVDAKVNLSKKNTPNLMEWWCKQPFFSYDRLERLIQYLLEAYTIYNNVAEIGIDDEYSYFDSDNVSQEDDLELESIKCDCSSNIDYGDRYYQVLKHMIQTLSLDRDVSSYLNKLEDLKNNKAFGDINELEKIVCIVQNEVRSRTLNNSKKWLSYSLSININKLYKSLKTNDYEQEIKKRFEFIDNVLINNNKSWNSYFESLVDIEDINLLYLDTIIDDNIKEFLDSILLSHDEKIDKFIEMMSEDKYTGYKDGKLDENNIFKQGNRVPFKDYEDIDGLYTNCFWTTNSQAIINNIEHNIELLRSKGNLSSEEQIKLQKLYKALKHIDEYNFAFSLELKIDKFIEMMSEDKYTGYKDGKLDENNIFKAHNKIPFKDYEDIGGLYIGGFWNNNYSCIKDKLNATIKFYESKNHISLEEQIKFSNLKKAIEAIKVYEFYTNIDLRIDKFIEMLNEDRYTSYKNGKPDENNIFKSSNKILFKDYKNIDGLYIGCFWDRNSQLIKEKIKKHIDSICTNSTQNPTLNLQCLKRAIKSVDKYEFICNIDLRIDKFIEMISEDKYTGYKDGIPDENNIFKQGNQVPFKDYEDIDGLYINFFWTTNSSLVKNRLNDKINSLRVKLNLAPQEQIQLHNLEIAQENIRLFEFYNNMELRIDKFIEMLDEDKYTGYKNGKPNKNNIFSRKNKVLYKGYERITNLYVGCFWDRNKKKHIIPKLFFDQKYSDVKYDKAREKVFNYLKLSPSIESIKEYAIKLGKKKI